MESKTTDCECCQQPNTKCDCLGPQENLKKFIVQITEKTISNYEVDASNFEEASDLTREGHAKLLSWGDGDSVVKVIREVTSW